MKKVLLFAALIMVAMNGRAENIGGLNYDLDNNTMTASVSNNQNATGDIVIPDSVVYNGNTYTVTAIGEWAFEGCSGLTSITIGSGVTTIGNMAFENCSSLTSVTIPDGVTSIGTGAFSYCSGLTTITIPDAVTFIGERAFEGCTNLFSATIGSNTLTVASNNPTMGKPYIGFPSCTVNFDWNSYSYDTTFWDHSVYAIANSAPNHHLTMWSDSCTTETDTIILTGDLSLIAFYEIGGIEGINDIEANNIRIYSADGRIRVEGAEGMEVKVYDLEGREIVYNTYTSTLPNGIYLVKVGTLPARKVVVVR